MYMFTRVTRWRDWGPSLLADMLQLRAFRPGVDGRVRCWWDSGTTVLISPYLMHRNAAAWPEPQRFWPERWLDAGGSDGRAGQQTDGSAGRPGMRMHSALADMGPNGASIRAAVYCSAVWMCLWMRVYDLQHDLQSARV